MQYSRFAIDERPVCVWDMDIKKLNSDFIKNINTDYYEFVSDSNEQIIDNEKSEDKDRIYASLNLRIHYSLALETLFSLIGAFLQAPDCILGWLLKYRNHELESLVKKINEKKQIKTKLPIENISWDSVAKLILNYFPNEDKNRQESTSKKFSTLLRNFANDFIDEKFKDENNSIKHGFRISRTGGASLQVRESTKEGKPKEGAEWITLMKSDYGSSFYIDEKIQDKPNNIRIKNYMRNWNPENFCNALYMISICIFNIRACLCAINKIDIKEKHYKSVESSLFRSPWSKYKGLGEGGINLELNFDAVKVLTDEQIMSVYDS